MLARQVFVDVVEASSSRHRRSAPFKSKVRINEVH
jgi:hypothetical protein